MREILFRGKRIDDGDWATGGIWIEEGVVFIVGKTRYYPDTRDWDTMEYYETHPHYVTNKIRIDQETIGQYTGFKDKNGKKIFEGDILKCTLCGEHRSVVFDEHYGEFEFDNRDPVENPDGSCLCCDHDVYEIIGNVHDNPELLGGTV